MLNRIRPEINYLIPIIPVIIWFFLSNQQIEIRYWKIQVNGFLWIIGMMILANSIELMINKREAWR